MLIRNVKFRVKGVEHRSNVICDDVSQIASVLADSYKARPDEIEIVTPGIADGPPRRRHRETESPRSAAPASQAKPASSTPPIDPVPLAFLRLAADVEKKLLENGLDSVQKVVAHLTQHQTLVGLKGIGKTTDEAIKAALEAASERAKAGGPVA